MMNRADTETDQCRLRDRGIDAVLMNGRGYFYFSGPAVELASSTSVWVYRLNRLTMSQWMGELDRIVSESKK